MEIVPSLTVRPAVRMWMTLSLPVLDLVNAPGPVTPAKVASKVLVSSVPPEAETVTGWPAPLMAAGLRVPPLKATVLVGEPRLELEETSRVPPERVVLPE